jgi:hypothetical protein
VRGAASRENKDRKKKNIEGNVPFVVSCPGFPLSFSANKPLTGTPSITLPSLAARRVRQKWVSKGESHRSSDHDCINPSLGLCWISWLLDYPASDSTVERNGGHEGVDGASFDRSRHHQGVRANIRWLGVSPGLPLGDVHLSGLSERFMAMIASWLGRDSNVANPHRLPDALASMALRQ